MGLLQSEPAFVYDEMHRLMLKPCGVVHGALP